MTENIGLPSADEFRRLENSIKELRQELELCHHQQAYLQLQISALVDGNSNKRMESINTHPRWRSLLIKIAESNSTLLKIATRVNRFLRR